MTSAPGSILDHSRGARECTPTDKHACLHTSAAHGPYLPPKHTPIFLMPSYDGEGHRRNGQTRSSGLHTQYFKLCEENPVFYNQTLSF